LWVPYWERSSGATLEESYHASLRELRDDIHRVPQHSGHAEDLYVDAVAALAASSPAARGSGTKTALLAAYASHLCCKEPLKAVKTIANTLGTDTDTIGTMAGALSGSFCDAEPPESVMDSDYLLSEADRLYDISQKRPREAFAYPDLLYWKAPKART